MLARIQNARKEDSLALVGKVRREGRCCINFIVHELELIILDDLFLSLVQALIPVLTDTNSTIPLSNCKLLVAFKKH